MVGLLLVRHRPLAGLDRGPINLSVVMLSGNDTDSAMEECSVQRDLRPKGVKQPLVDQTSRRRLITLGLTALGTPALAHVAAAQSEIRAPWHSQTAPLPTVEMLVGDERLTVEVAADPASRARGLGYRHGLAPGTGMLFIFDEAAERSFWMKGMRFCLDIIWIHGGQILGAAVSVCPDPLGTADEDRASYHSGEPAQHVLEVPANWMAERGFRRGTPVDIPEHVLIGN